MKVLVPVDGLEASLRAVDYAIKMADSSLVLLNVQDLCIANEFTEVKDIAEQEAAKALKEATDKAEAAGADFKSVVRTGQVAERIVQVARAEDVQHIVMGTRGLGRALGSVEGHPLGGSSDYADQVAVRIRNTDVRLRKLKWFAIHAWKGALQAEQSARRVGASGTAA